MTVRSRAHNEFLSTKNTNWLRAPDCSTAHLFVNWLGDRDSKTVRYVTHFNVGQIIKGQKGKKERKRKKDIEQIQLKTKKARKKFHIPSTYESVKNGKNVK